MTPAEIRSPTVPTWLDREAYPFESRFVSLEDGYLHYVDEGEGDVVVLVHGTPTWSFEYRHVIRALRSRHRVIAFDHLGFGLSERPANADYGPEAHARRFAELVDTLHLTRFSLAVHDFGGPIALPFAEENPERIASLLLLNTFAGPIDDDPVMRRRARFAGSSVGRLLYRYLNASLRLIMPSAYGVASRLTPAIHAQYLACFPDGESRVRVLHALARALLGASAHYASIDARREALAAIPTTIVWGLSDSAFGLAYLDRLRASFPHAQTVLLEQAGHWPHEEEPGRVIAAFESHLARVESRV